MVVYLGHGFEDPLPVPIVSDIARDRTRDLAASRAWGLTDWRRGRQSIRSRAEVAIGH